MNTNKKQKIALIVGAVILAIVIFAPPRIQKFGDQKYRANHNAYAHNQFDVSTILIGGGVVAVFTFVAFIILKSKD